MPPWHTACKKQPTIGCKICNHIRYAYVLHFSSPPSFVISCEAFEERKNLRQHNEVDVLPRMLMRNRKGRALRQCYCDMHE